MPKALSHGADVAALFVVVRTVVEVLARNGRPLREPARAGFDLLERWDGGEGVETSALLRAQGLVHENEVPVAEREPERALSWAKTAIGNLLWMAQKTRARWAPSACTTVVTSRANHPMTAHATACLRSISARP